MTDEQIPQVRIRDGVAAQAQTGTAEVCAGVAFPSDPQPGQTYEIEAEGHKIGIRWWSALERMRFFSMIGGADSMNPGVLSVAMPGYLISSVDGQAFAKRPLNLAGLETKIEKLGDAAIVPAWDAISPMFAIKSEEEKEAQDADLKNG